MEKSSWMRVGMAAAGCAAVGAVAGIAGGAAAPTGKQTASKPPAWRMFKAGRHGPRVGMGMGMLGGGPGVHAEIVVPKRSGSGFETVTQDSGKLKSRSGDTVTIADGTPTETYKDADVTIPSGATIVRNGAKATLDDLKTGDFIRVASSPEGTFVMARDASFQPPAGAHGYGDRGPGRPGGGPPPFAP